MTGLSIEPLTPAVGSVVNGVKFTKLDDSDFSKIRTTLFERCMIVFPNQAVDDTALLDFAGRWGEIMVTPMLTYITVSYTHLTLPTIYSV